MSRVTVLGTGLIGGSVGLAARASGHEVCGFDPDTARLERAHEIGALDAVAPDLATAVADADLVVVAVPVGRAADVVIAALDAGAAVVTDVGSVKAAVVSAVEAARPDARGAVRRRASDGGLGAGRSRRRRRRHVPGRNLGAHADARHGPGRLRDRARPRGELRR